MVGISYIGMIATRTKNSLYKAFVSLLIPPDPDYNNTIIRGGREEMLDYLSNPRLAYEERREFLY